MKPRDNSASSQSNLHPEGAPALERRSFLGKLAGLMMSAIGAVVAFAAGRYTLYPAFEEDIGTSARWVDAGLLDEIPDGQPVKRSVVISEVAGWGQFNTQRLVWIVRRGNQLQVFSATCPHLGCTVNAAPNGFICPCHGSAWDAQGERVGGPTRRGLDTLEYQVREGVIYIRYQFFKPSIAEKIAIG